ncbi:hypothetical protein [Nevskia sp.]|uniref:hypothetical protein n=1 Tax=Nevskia sp. TaxID=1929292 RepID=UPI0025D1119A|nr:hypothetical protein [Nevskia sp.]
MTAANPAPRESQIVGTTHLLTFATSDHHVAIVLMNDGLQARAPSLTPDQADALAAQITRVAAKARAEAQAAQAAAEAANEPPPRQPPPYPKPLATPATSPRLI